MLEYLNFVIVTKSIPSKGGHCTKSLLWLNQSSENWTRLLEHIKRHYKQVELQLRTKDGLNVKGGIRQGDPMSTLPFLPIQCGRHDQSIGVPASKFLTTKCIYIRQRSCPTVNDWRRKGTIQWTVMQESRKELESEKISKIAGDSFFEHFGL